MKSILTITLVLITVLIPDCGFGQDLNTQINVKKGQVIKHQNDFVINITQLGQQETKVVNKASSIVKYEVNNVLANGNIEIVSTNWNLVRTILPSDTVYIPKRAGTIQMEGDKYGTAVFKAETDTADGTLLNLGNNLVFAGIFCEFPKKDVLKNGEKWSISKNDSASYLGGKLGLALKNEYTLGSVEQVDGKPMQKISFTSTILMSGKAKQEGTDVFIKGNCAGGGTIYIDPVSKIVYSNNAAVEVLMDMTVSGHDTTHPINQKITLTQKLI